MYCELSNEQLIFNFQAANMMRCENCGGKHRRFPVARAWYDARFCDKCNTRHSAKEVGYASMGNYKFPVEPVMVDCLLSLNTSSPQRQVLCKANSCFGY